MRASAVYLYKTLQALRRMLEDEKSALLKRCLTPPPLLCLRPPLISCLLLLLIGL
jgi:hypothetical protein